MKVAFDHQIFSCQQYGGISRYFRMLADGLYGLDGVEPHVVAPQYVADAVAGLPTGVRTRCGCGPSSFDSVSDRLGAALPEVRSALGELRPDVVHETYYTAESPTWDGAPVAVTVHDMNHEKYPQLCHPNDRTAHFKRAALEWADCVICVSAATRHDLLELTPVDPSRVFVVHHGVAPLHDGAPDPEPPQDRPFLLFVGHRGGYKNFTTLVRALAASRRLNDELDLVCVGGGPFSREERAMLDDAGLRRGSVIHRQCEDRELARHYVHARALVFPSLGEGFGMPVLEAMQYGCPVACARAGAFPEVGGDAALYFDPAEPQDMAAVLESLALSDTLHSRLAAAGPVHAGRFTWRACAENTLAVYGSLG